ncbi:MAG: hypothetical protein HY244_13360 [Rhizobiales bacterium]|nr:hypothetical protein [Hyphomicrobiales bacterium]
MQDAQYFREQANLCLDVARQVSDRTLAEGLRLDAAQYFMRAMELENKTEPSTSQRRSQATAKQ